MREQLPAIETAVEAVTELDFIKAKVEFARSFKAIVPKISDDETLDLIEARHPLLEENLRNISTQRNRETEKKEAETRASARVQNAKENYPQINTDEHRSESKGQSTKDKNQSNEIVPVSFKLTKQNPVMIISGANAGGKTVVLKTAGLLSLMAISGLPVPAKDAQIPFYRSVLGGHRRSSIFVGESFDIFIAYLEHRRDDARMQKARARSA